MHSVLKILVRVYLGIVLRFDNRSFASFEIRKRSPLQFLISPFTNFLRELPAELLTCQTLASGL